MSAGERESGRYWPQLDGVRAVAIASVVAYHLGDLSGGWIGVDVFFVLSGYLITGILLSDGPPLSRLTRFWGRRARRLLPAVLTLLAVLSVYAWVGGPGLVPAQLRDPALATLLYGANWQQIAAGHSYFAQFTGPSPLQHTWSLAIEEQYYVVWPLLLGGISLLARSRRFLLWATASMAVLSATWMGIAEHLFGANRAYLGTDTRAWELLLGGLAAMLWPPASQVTGRLWSRLSVAGLAAVVFGMVAAGGPPQWIWDGGLVLIGLGAAAMVVGSVQATDGILARVLSLGPVRWLGTISYSLYIWHWPVIVLMDEDTTGLSGAALLLARLATMLVAACCSYYLIERPLRRADWAGLGRRIHLPSLGFPTLGLIGAAVLILFGTVGPASAQSANVSSSGIGAPPAQEISARFNLPPATPGHPYRVWILGDSVMADASPGITAALQSTGEVSVVINSSFAGWGLTTDHTWAANAEQIIGTYHPQIVIGTWSWDDTAAVDHPAQYLAELEAAMRLMLAPGDGVDQVLLLQFPQTGPAPEITNPTRRAAAWAEQTRVQDAWDSLARKATDAFPGHALYLTTDRLFAPGGRFYTWFRTPAGTWVRARKLDNTHFCPYGAAEFGALITEDLKPALSLPAMKPGWELGPWTHDTRYNDPPGACPDDQPPAGYHGIDVP